MSPEWYSFRGSVLNKETPRLTRQDGTIGELTLYVMICNDNKYRSLPALVYECRMQEILFFVEATGKSLNC